MMTQVPDERGFTLIELLIVVVLIAIILALAVPSFTALQSRKRLEGVASELSADIQYARSEAAQRNAPVRIIFGSTCYAIHVVGSTNASDCTTLGTAAVPLKLVQAALGTSYAFVSNNSKAWIEFDPVRGMARDSAGTDASGYVTTSSGAGNWQVRTVVTTVGRVKVCSPNSTIAGLTADCS